MTADGEALAEQIRETNQQIIEAIERCSDEQWRATTASENWPVGVTAHHIGESDERGVARVKAALGGQPFRFPPGMETSDARNAVHLQQQANCTKEETLALLRGAEEAATSLVRSMSNEDLGRTEDLDDRRRSVRQLIEVLLINHPRNHLESIQATL